MVIYFCLSQVEKSLNWGTHVGTVPGKKNKEGQNFENHIKVHFFYTLESTLKGPYVNQKNTFHQHKPQTNKANTAEHGEKCLRLLPLSIDILLFSLSVNFS